MVSIGFGYPLKVDLYGEKRGYIPNSKVYDKIHKQRWTSSSIISIAIGQGEILATPLQIANLATVIANRGWFYRPHVVRAIENSTLDTAYTSKKYTTIDPSHWETVVEGMARAVTGGTCTEPTLLRESSKFAVKREQPKILMAKITRHSWDLLRAIIRR